MNDKQRTLVDEYNEVEKTTKGQDRILINTLKI